MEKTVYHKFVAFSMVDKSGTVVPKFVQCNNCGVVHKVYDLCKSEIVPGKDELKSVASKEEVKIGIPTQLWDALETHGVDISLLEHVKFIFEYEKWGDSVIISKENIDNDVVGKKLVIESSKKFKFIPFLYSSNEIEIL